ncbi:permease [Oleiphilus sp. HI0125]|uniref:sulfite exporter TauE/SafE family protein n=1 Tax=Oleiphilus sp. HI0125 TaxID=1822266 RepID=UPI0007C2F9F1|nr:sulfite exporter TauE/SafE family protein [Oleiphilus sp. HI0125]KZZ57246.1 permease [Oleiphilus sp. HI0125]
MYELSVLSVSLLIAMGFLAGIINTMAGGGSNLTIPALMVMGLPADIANATNRVNVFFQSLTAAKGFKSHGKLEIPDLKKIVGVTLIGGLAGALLASYMPAQLLKPTLLISMITMAGIILFKPGVVAPPEGTQALGISESSSSIPMLLLAGFYGGFVQAGVGFILIAAIAGSLRYDLVRTNALKIVCTLGFTIVALLIFIVNDQILWLPGLILAVGSIVGAHIAVKITINLSQKTLKWFLFLMTIFASAAALLT